MTSTQALPTYFISHGGGPWPWMKQDMPGLYDQLEAALQDMPRQIGVTPQAVLVISGHWEENDFTVMSAAKPPMIYDYGGFPEHTYHIKYAAPGSPDLARRVQELLTKAGIPTRLNETRGFDHGTFTPLAVMYPKADVPIIQLSMKRGYDPKTHLDAGRALAVLRGEGILIVGSGLSYHNLRKFGGPEGPRSSRAFDGWLDETLCLADRRERAARLLQWDKAPMAREAHPREDHLIPLMVAVGAAFDDEATRVYYEETFFGGLTVSSYRFGSKS